MEQSRLTATGRCASQSFAFTLGFADIFLSCLIAIEVQYWLYIDEGVTVVHPAGNRTIDFNAADESLLGCMLLTARNMSIAAGKAASSDREAVDSIQASRATFLGSSARVPWV
ncbi:5-methyltetrahydropteroyltriglutamate-homocysteine methyltransferase [Penicillium atrosanguineum]|uniref:5-methyltetrahydropteroyltriglutamate- homocysteine methyltransferase n=1 Tax=Penicillium atrosanguineum TaxID=1132637 RepID=UPI00238B8F35|nr:5-methyltetrahydropteroyltriglutamate-homocysteine methyltransferase [Penicillium atrosanguineum]KAJ5301147.1 5-methyltetrahydropteroyltriglutamate-homocysteine methyltransferase [Penicillium atrosanguineum]